MKSTEQERASYEGGAWYWVEKEGWHDEPPKIAPAMYRADCDAWYSWEFSGISTPYLKVLEPCTRIEQAARRAPVVPQFNQVAQKKLDYLLEAGEAITGYAIENKDGRRGAIDCHGFVYWWQDAAAPQPPEGGFSVSNAETSAAPVQMPEPMAYYDGERWYANEEAAICACADLTKLEKVYAEQQVRQLLAAQPSRIAELCAQMCDSRASSLFKDGQATAATEAKKCASVLRNPPDAWREKLLAAREQST